MVGIFFVSMDTKPEYTEGWLQLTISIWQMTPLWLQEKTDFPMLEWSLWLLCISFGWSTLPSCGLFLCWQITHLSWNPRLLSTTKILGVAYYCSTIPLILTNTHPEKKGNLKIKAVITRGYGRKEDSSLHITDVYGANNAFVLIGWYISWEGVYLESGGSTCFSDYYSKAGYREKPQSVFLASRMDTLCF